MAYTTINKSTDYFNTKLYTGNGGTNAITGVGFQPDFVWLKSRSQASTDHKLLDAVRGAPNFLSSNLTAAEASTGSFNSIDSDGFTVDTTNASYNQSSATYASWNWKAGGTGSSNTDGSITSTVSANTTAGFSIVKYTGTGSSATVGHGLGAVPQVLIIKDLDSSTDWQVYHVNEGANDKLRLNTSDYSANTNSFGGTTPTSSVFTVNPGGGETNNSGNNNIAYCFAEKKGYSKFGSYTGNGNADGTFVYTGFKPTFLLYKRSDSTGYWRLHDTKRDPHNVAYHNLFANEAEAEGTTDSSTGYNIDILSNGFKLRTTLASSNNSGGTWIYMAIGQSLVGSNNVPCTAR